MALTTAELRRVLLDCVTDAELVTLIDACVDERTRLAARAIVAPADVDDRAQAIACELSIRDFRREQERRKGL